MNFYRIDMDRWSRKPYFEHYMKESKCSYSITANLNVTTLLDRLQNKKVKLYPAFIYMVSRVVNSHTEFRTTFNDKGQLGYWDHMIPNYTIFHKEDKTFSAMWTEYSNDFSLFYKNYQCDMEQFGDKKGLWAKENVPVNTFSISSLPWVSFTGFNLNLYNEEYLLPIITGGKYFSDGKEILLPVSLQVHHAVCDGYHVSTFINDLQKLADSCEEWVV
ncbi:chloramphenicol acetyltransferase [Aneurinibacillus migulanus]|uniref:type A chloramphenicol O-acetyltransferase n=1 Tax=Aneurinibacillus migulanus TaxID=47500 RepID=UPI0005BBFBF6|nr:type A chloramphenicol O-acetyltransferase [Aneurinibacillus migulanus]KIV59351.1 chloramphenicol acetyltransferase [Aneurinibacillus migulanus]KPD08712.1 chloramphenicol acetyltransferase [Aneurinibacillus migulanus]MCP1356222.1 type A chloramphenicol O-acetyltransferase [Aneurinibacillus migulanus]CEH28098.1 Chloramphenicol acetyltransferase [Aneurinibacillus migulanus]